MGKTKIEWATDVWNPVTGCSKVSQGCKFCYAEREFPRVYPGRTFADVQTHQDRLTQPLHWKRPRNIFVNSMSDLFHEILPDGFIDECFAVMYMAPQHTYQVLTKRPERMLAWASRSAMQARLASGKARVRGTPWGNDAPRVWPLPNVWLGVSVEDQKTADERIPLLLQTPAAVRWVSYEPALGPVDLTALPSVSGIGRHLDALSNAGCHGADVPTKLDWVVAGGESGPKARPSHPDWFRAVRDECQAAGVPYFHKQNGEWIPSDGDDQPRELIWLAHDGRTSNQPDFIGDDCPMQMEKVGKKAAGRLLDGREWNDYPDSGVPEKGVGSA